MLPIDTVMYIFDQLNCASAVLDDGGAVIALNAYAKRLLRRRAVNGASLGCAKAGSPTLLLRRLFGKDLALTEGGTVIANTAKPLVRPIVGCKIMLSARSDDGPRMILLMLDLDERRRPAIALLRGIFRLTEAEARLAARLASGDSLQKIATDHRVAIDTVRGQLKSVLAKTHTHRQAELVTLMSRLAIVDTDAQVKRARRPRRLESRPPS